MPLEEQDLSLGLGQDGSAFFGKDLQDDGRSSPEVNARLTSRAAVNFAAARLLSLL